MRVGLLLLLVPPAVAAGLYLGRSLVLAVLITVLAEAGFCVLVLRTLRRRGFRLNWHRADFSGWLTVLLASCGCLLAARSLGMPPLPGALAMTLIVSMCSLYAIRVLATDEAALVAQWSPRLARLLGLERSAA